MDPDLVIVIACVFGMVLVVGLAVILAVYSHGGKAGPAPKRKGIPKEVEIIKEIASRNLAIVKNFEVSISDGRVKELVMEMENGCVLVSDSAEGMVAELVKFENSFNSKEICDNAIKKMMEIK